MHNRNPKGVTSALHASWGGVGHQNSNSKMQQQKLLLHVTFIFYESVHCSRAIPAIRGRGIRRPSGEVKPWREYLNHDVRMHSMMRRVSAADGETIQYSQNN
ncbi:hypothetical protein EVAR_97546_1 [Eumeta japonica]|uniref:Uncharacterized protein n=1 Tax=Eumeta variegata TaxID=151549 RepID=A0A4C1WPM3_EUMVA|nr:hypothetical protein EVAR_97546_1 [Eumeta japonica]